IWPRRSVEIEESVCAIPIGLSAPSRAREGVERGETRAVGVNLEDGVGILSAALGSAVKGVSPQSQTSQWAGAIPVNGPGRPLLGGEAVQHGESSAIGIDFENGPGASTAAFTGSAIERVTSQHQPRLRGRTVVVGAIGAASRSENMKHDEFLAVNVD